MSEGKSSTWKSVGLPILSSTLFGGVIGVIIDVVTKKPIMFTIIFGALGLLYGVARYLLKNKKSGQKS